MFTHKLADRRSASSGSPAELSLTNVEKRRICIVAPGHWSDVMGGAQYQTMLLVRALAAKGNWDITYIAKHVKHGYQSDDHKIVRIRNRWNRTRGLGLDALHVYQALKQVAPHVIYHRGSTAYSGLVAYYSHRTGTRTVWHVASNADVTPFRFQLSKGMALRFMDRKLFEFNLSHADAIVAQTADQARLLEKNYGQRATAIVYNFHPLPEEQICKVSPAEVVWIGNIKPLKQPEVFIQAAKDLQGLTNARFVMIGGMQVSGRRLQGIRRAIDAAPNLTYRGACTQQEVNQVLARAAVLVNTSLWEGFSNTFIQAWMRRVPVVSLHVNPDGVFSAGRLGLCSGTPERLKADILRLVNDETLRERMGRDSESYAIEHHSLTNIDRLMSLIENRRGP